MSALLTKIAALIVVGVACGLLASINYILYKDGKYK